MISVVLYGRNDSHGYNLHKRAAISLNAIAHLLNAPDDEIVFVDYNTPDDLPTFPEAIADTLTQKAWSKLRILRVRPKVHDERFAARTHLNALEPIARNVAIRRSNPANRWVLSTNTDMIFIPLQAGADLTSVTAALEDGFYHLPRFELPEGLWETLDRKDAPGMIASVKDWGERFHLNEVVHSGFDNLYDGPGDFQLFLREDLFRIGGFHEEMIRGWHLDANVARRMRLLRGEVSSALPWLIGYHCDHTRQASAYHKADRLENDAERFVNQVYEPEIPGQADDWGLADVEIEELKLGQASGALYLKGLEAAVGGRLEGFLECRYVAEAHGGLDYTPEHVLPYLLDLVSCVPRDARIAYVGARPDVFAAVCKAWAAMGGTRAPAFPQEAAWLAGQGGEAAGPVADWLRDADLFVFEVGAEAAGRHEDLTAEESARLWRVDQAFKAVAEAEARRRDDGAAPRRAVIVNGVHNFFEPQVFAEVAVTLTPFSSRIRHGYFASRAEARRAGASGALRRAMTALGALEPPILAERLALKTLTDRLASVPPGHPAWLAAGRYGAEIAALAEAGVPELADLAGSERLERIAAMRPSRRIPEAAAVLSPAAGAGSPSRLARLEDWEDPAWVDLTRRMFANRDHARWSQRSTWFWERVCLTANLLAAKPAQTEPEVLVVGDAPERLAMVLAYLGLSVDIASASALAAGERRAEDWRAAFRSEAWVSPRPVGLIHERPPGRAYDAVILTQNALFLSGRTGAAALVRHAAELLKPGGHLGLTAHVLPFPGDNRRGEPALPNALAAGDGLSKAFEAFAGLAADGACDGLLTPRTFDRLSENGDETADPPFLVKGIPPEVETLGVWSFTKRADGEPDWRALDAVFTAGRLEAGLSVEDETAGEDLSAVLGPLFSALKPAPGVAVTPVALRAAEGGAGRPVASVELGRLAPGVYELTVEFAAPAGEALTASLSDADGTIWRATLSGAGGPDRATTEFEVAADRAAGLVLRLGAASAGAVEVRDAVVR